MSVSLKKSNFEGVSSAEIAQQLEGRKKSKKKLPLWFGTPHIYFPKKVQLEQTSSEITAEYKASLVDGSSLIDLTGGFGVDTYFFSKKIPRVTHCEMDVELAGIAQYNHEILGASGINYERGNSISYLESCPNDFDWVYADPSRRSEKKGKVFMLQDCIPNMPEILPVLFSKTKNILIKTAPLLDILAGEKELTNVKEVHVVAVKNEVKELLWILEKGFEAEALLQTINFEQDHVQKFSFLKSEEKKIPHSFAFPKTYLYEPNAAILKSGAFKTVASRFQVEKLSEHTHLYTSDDLVEFPGRRFQIENTYPYSKAGFKSFRLQKANISTRNFPEKVDAIRKKLKIKDGGPDYLFFAKDLKGSLVFVHCTRV